MGEGVINVKNDLFGVFDICVDFVVFFCDC